VAVGNLGKCSSFESKTNQFANFAAAAMSTFSLGGRLVGADHPPLVIAEIGINHEGELDKAMRMIEDAKRAGCEVCKFQSHVIEDEMIPEAKNVVPGNADVSIWSVMERCALSEDCEKILKERVESLGMIFLSTPFSRAAADRLESMGVCGYKIGSGECNNYPLVKHIASFGKPIILSTGMNDIQSITCPYRFPELLTQNHVST